MTNEERKALIAQGWTPPVAVDPDTLADPDTFEASAIIINQNIYGNVEVLILDAIRRGRALATAEAKPGLVWVKHDWSNHCPVDPDSYVWIKCHTPFFGQAVIRKAAAVGWTNITHYAIITPPEDVA